MPAVIVGPSLGRDVHTSPFRPRTPSPRPARRARAAFDRLAQQAGGELARVERQIAVAEQRRRRGRCRSARRAAAAADRSRRMPASAPRSASSRSSAGVEHSCRRDRAMAFATASQSMPSSSMRAGEVDDREPRAPPGVLGLGAADLARQLGQRLVDLELHQRGGGRGRAVDGPRRSMQTTDMAARRSAPRPSWRR